MRGWKFVGMLAVLAGLLPTSPAAALPGCQVETTWRYCGQHWRASSLPIRFRMNPSGAPASVTSADLTAAITGAMQAWNLAWPRFYAVDDDLSPVLQYVGTTAFGFGRDGQSTIVFGSTSMCGDADAAAVACAWYEGSSGLGALRIAEVDIIIDPGRAWKHASAMQTLVGEMVGLTPYGQICSVPWWDLQSTLTHEFGHALGLKHIGDPKNWFPAGRPQDVYSFTETMYLWDYPCTTNKRTLDQGDIAGLQQIAFDSSSD